RLGMADWALQAPPSSDQGTCVDTGVLDPASSTLTLRALSGPVPPNSVMERLAVELRSIAHDCAPLDETAQRVRSAAGGLGLSEDRNEFELTEVPDASAACTSISENVGGTIFLVLRGPSA
ncbi:MAG TPA: hypothetical protein VNN79_02580, partial [Actinomycetota bacterium]|nr:hypothetical protein [Actinomycetota bacterium]